MSSPSTPPNWYPDPTGRFESRWFDGTNWTDQVSSGGQTQTDPMPPAQPGAGGTTAAEKVQQQVEKRAGIQRGAAQGGGTLFTEPVLVVNQKAKLIEITNEYAVFDQNGNQIGAVRQTGQSKAKKVLRVATNLDQFMTHHLEVVDHAGVTVLKITRPRAFMKSKLLIENGAGQEVGSLQQENRIGKIRFGMYAGGEKVGLIQGENWRAWNFAILDAADVEVARITKTWEGFGKALFTTADNYVVQIHRPLQDPLLSLVVASAVSVDTALKQASN
jgi:uncharacterized protein YxjI